MSPSSQIHAKISGPIVMIGFGSIGKGTLPLIERHFAYDKSRFVDHRSARGRRAGEKARRTLHQAGDDPRQLPRGAGAAADRRRRPGLLRQSVGGYRLGRHHGPVPRDRRALYRHRRRAVARLLFRQESSAPRSARTTRCAKRCWRPSSKSPGGTTAVSTCGANPGMVSWFVKQALLDIARDTKTTFNEPKSREGLGPARAQARRQGHPYRRARHPALQEAEADERVRQHLVGGRLRVRRHAAGRTRLGHA